MRTSHSARPFRSSRSLVSPVSLAAALLVAFASATVACGGGGGGGTVTIAPIAPAPAEPAAAPDGGASTSSSNGSNVKAPGEAKIGDTAHCPVSGEEFVVTDASPHADHNGKTYYFCCAGCAKKFSADPAKYIGAGGTKSPS